MSYHGEKISSSLTPQVFSGSAFVAAQANAPASVADVVLLSTGERIKQGHVVWRAHGLTVGSHYFLSQTAAGGYTATAPTVGLSQRLFFVLDANTILVDVQPAVVGGQPAGAVLKVQVFHAGEIVASATADFTIMALIVDYTPVSASSFLIVEADAHYWLGGWGVDAWQSRIFVDGSVVSTKTQRFAATEPGGGTRGSTALPIMGRYQNASTAAKNIQVVLDRSWGNDTGNLSNTDRWIKVTEIQG